MTNFSSSQPVSLSVKGSSVANATEDLYDDLHFNLKIESKVDADSIIYSIDIGNFLKAIEKKDFDRLQRITLIGGPAQQTTGLWDTLFNSNRRRNNSACIMVASPDYKPVPQNQIIASSNFLDYNRSVSRLHFNRLQTDDRVGVAIYDQNKGFTYVLLYKVDGTTRTRAWNDARTDSHTVSVANMSLEHVVTYDQYQPANATVVTADGIEYDQEKTAPFVEWLINSVIDIPTAYSWKPHFLPRIPTGGVVLSEVEARLKEKMVDIKDVSFAEFETLCDTLYSWAKKRHDQVKREMAEKKKQERRAKIEEMLPLIEVVSSGDTFMVTVGDKMVRFTKEDMGNQTIRETYLTNQDLVGTNYIDIPQVTVMSKDFGELALLRYFTVNF